MTWWWNKATNVLNSECIDDLYKSVGQSFKNYEWRYEAEEVYELSNNNIYPIVQISFIQNKSMDDLFEILITWLSNTNTKKNILTKINKILIILFNSCDETQTITKHQNIFSSIMYSLWNDFQMESASNVLLQLSKSPTFQIDLDNVISYLIQSLTPKIATHSLYNDESRKVDVNALYFILKTLSHCGLNTFIDLFSNDLLVDVVANIAINMRESPQTLLLAVECLYVAIQIDQNYECIQLNKYVLKQWNIIQENEYNIELIETIKRSHGNFNKQKDEIKWLESLQIGDRLDVIVDIARNEWKVGEIIDINMLNDENKIFTIYLDGDDNKKSKYKIYASMAIIIRNTISPLGTNTAYHFYYSSPNSIEICEYMSSANNRRRRHIGLCSFCEQEMCQCALIESQSSRNNKWYSECRECVIKNDISKMSKILENILQNNDINVLDINVLNVISEFAMGLIVECSNYDSNKKYQIDSIDTNCAQMISFKNRFDFFKGYDENEQTIYYYESGRKSLKYVTTGFSRCKYRIFCVKCKTLLTNCGIWRCDKKDIDSSSCGAHPECNCCGHRVDGITIEKCGRCERCKEFVCDNQLCLRARLCRICHEKREKKRLFQVIEQHIGNIFDYFIVGLICDFSVGLLVNCCNKTCEDEIHLTSKWLYQRGIKYMDFNKQCIYSYEIDMDEEMKQQEMKQQDDIRCILGQYRRIFCCKCMIDKSCTECLMANCDNMDTDDVCYNHPFCTECNKRSKYKTRKCGVCDEYICDYCIIHSQCKEEQIKIERHSLELLDEKQLKYICKSRKLSTKGNKNKLINRILKNNELLDDKKRQKYHIKKKQKKKKNRFVLFTK